MVIRNIFLLLVLATALSCSELEYEDDALPATDQLQPGTISTSLPVVEIFADQAEFDRMYADFDAKIIIPASIRMSRPQQGLIFDTTAMRLEIKGASSASYDMKSLGITFVKDLPNYELGMVNPPQVLEGDDLSHIKSVRLRNSGNDFDETMIKDLAYHKLAIQAGVDFELMYGEPVQVFVNNRYYGLLNLRTESNREGVSRLYGVETDDIIAMEVDIKNGNLEFDGGNGSYAYQLRDAIEAKDALKLYQMLDIPSFIDYVVFQDYIGNRDWPHNNVKANSINGEPFRFFLFDLDKASYDGKFSKLAQLEYDSDDVGKIYQALITIPGFNEDLQQRQRELYRRMSPDRFNVIVDQLVAQIEDEIPYLISKYQLPPNTMQWKINVEDLKRDFEKRDYFIRKKYNLR